MSEGEPWDAGKVAAECAATAREKTKGKRKRGEPPTIPVTSETSEDDPPMREGKDEIGRFLPGHTFSPGTLPGHCEKFKPEFTEQAEKLAKMGATVNEMADFFHVAPSTFHYWRHTHPEFADAVKQGRARKPERAAMSLYQRAVGYDFIEEQAIKVASGAGKDRVERVEIVEVRKHMPSETLANIFFLTNADPENFKHRRTLEVSGTIEHVTPDQARRELADFLANGQIIDVTPVQLPAPDAEEAGIAPASP